MGKLVTFFTVGTVVILALAIVAQADATGQAGTTLEASVTVLPHWTITYGWTIEKSVTPDVWALACGESGTSTYTVSVAKDSGMEEAWVDGEVCVTNGGERATEGLAIFVELKNGYAPPNDYLAGANVDVSSNPVLDPGETGCYAYRVDIPITGGEYPQPHAGGTYKVTANVTITNHSGRLGEPFGPSPSATTVFPFAPTLVSDVINVDDTNGGSWEFSASGSVSYDKTFTCPDDAGEHVNTATIRETGQSASATVTVSCAPCVVSCTRTPGYWKTHSRYGPAPYDNTWGLIGEDTAFFKSGQSWYQVLWTEPAGGNAYYILAHAYIAARLNIASGAASTPEVDAALAWAETFFGTYVPTSKLSKALRAQAVSYAGVLDQYNNGYIGPGHCVE